MVSCVWWLYLMVVIRFRYFVGSFSLVVCGMVFKIVILVWLYVCCSICLCWVDLIWLRMILVIWVVVLNVEKLCSSVVMLWFWLWVLIIRIIGVLSRVVMCVVDFVVGVFLVGLMCLLNSFSIFLIMVMFVFVILCVYRGLISCFFISIGLRLWLGCFVVRVW